MSQSNISNSMWDEIIKRINKDFLIRYHLTDSPNLTKLIGARNYRYWLGHELAYKHFTKVFESKEDKTTIKLRRGFTINFIAR